MNKNKKINFNILNNIVYIAIIAFMLFGMLGCSKSNLIITNKIETLNVNETYQCDINGEEARWESSDNTVATVDNGLITALKAGSTIITASNGQQSDSFILTIIQENYHISVDTQEVKLYADETQSLNVIFTINGYVKSNSLLTMSYSEEGIALYNPLNNTIKGLKVGSTLLTLSYKDTSMSINITVSEQPTYNITLVNLANKIYAGETITLEPVIYEIKDNESYIVNGIVYWSLKEINNDVIIENNNITFNTYGTFTLLGTYLSPRGRITQVFNINVLEKPTINIECNINQDLYVNEEGTLTYTIKEIYTEYENIITNPIGILYNSQDINIISNINNTITLKPLKAGSLTLTLTYEKVDYTVNLVVNPEKAAVSYHNYCIGLYNEIKEAAIDESVHCFQNLPFATVIYLSNLNLNETGYIAISIHNADINDVRIGYNDASLESQTLESLDSDNCVSYHFNIPVSTTDVKIYLSGYAISDTEDILMSLSGSQSYCDINGTLHLTNSITILESLKQDLIYNKDIVCEGSEEEVNAIKKRMDEADSYLATGLPTVSDFINFIQLFNTIMANDYYNVYDWTGEAEVLYVMDKTNSSYKELYEYYNNFRLTIAEWYYNAILSVSQTSWRNTFFYGYTEEEIEDILDNCQAFDSDMTNLNQELDSVQKEFSALSSSDMLSSAPEYLSQVVSIGNTIAQKAGKSNYLEYMYNAYNRDYTYNDLASFKRYVITYLIPLLDSVAGSEPITNKSASNSDYITYLYYAHQNYKYLYLDDLLAEFYNYMGDDYNQIMNDFWLNGQWVFSNNTSKSINNGFTLQLLGSNEAIIYYGSSYQDASTIVHELGHYYAYKKSGITGMYMDLAETNSQGNEMMLLAYLTQYYQGYFTDLTWQEIKNRTLYSELITIILSTLVNDFEIYIYTHPETPYQDYQTIYETIAEDYGGCSYLYNLGINVYNYWRYVTVTNPGYYISYAMSGVASLSLLADTLDDYERGKTSYLTLCSSEIYNFTEALDNAGISSVFSETTYQRMSSILGIWSRE